MAHLLVTLVLCTGTLLVLLVTTRLVELAASRAGHVHPADQLRRTADELDVAVGELAAEVARRTDR